MLWCFNNSFISNISSDKGALNTVAAVCMWCGLVTTAVPLWAQSFGQGAVKPSEVLWYASTVLIAYMRAHDQLQAASCDLLCVHFEAD
jgi:hypothetical protein